MAVKAISASPWAQSGAFPSSTGNGTTEPEAALLSVTSLQLPGSAVSPPTNSEDTQHTEDR